MVIFQHSTHFTGNDQMVPAGQKVGGTHGTKRWKQKCLSKPGIKTLVMQPITSHYTDWATPTHSAQNTVVKTVNKNKTASFQSFQF